RTSGASRETSMDLLQFRCRRSASQTSMDSLQFAGGGIRELDAPAHEIAYDTNPRPEGQAKLFFDRLYLRSPAAGFGPHGPPRLDARLSGSHRPILGQDPLTEAQLG